MYGPNVASKVGITELICTTKETEDEYDLI